MASFHLRTGGLHHGLQLQLSCQQQYGQASHPFWRPQPPSDPGNYLRCMICNDSEV